jgi:hypothetical protein
MKVTVIYGTNFEPRSARLLRVKRTTHLHVSEDTQAVYSSMMTGAMDTLSGDQPWCVQIEPMARAVCGEEAGKKGRTHVGAREEVDCRRCLQWIQDHGNWEPGYWIARDHARRLLRTSA